jgi:hypothetical protein
MQARLATTAMPDHGHIANAICGRERHEPTLHPQQHLWQIPETAEIAAHDSVFWM